MKHIPDGIKKELQVNVNLEYYFRADGDGLDTFAKIERILTSFNLPVQIKKNVAYGHLSNCHGLICRGETTLDQAEKIRNAFEHLIHIRLRYCSDGTFVLVE